VSPVLAPADLAVDRRLADISESFRFLLDLTPVNVPSARTAFLGSDDEEPSFEYRDLEDSPRVLRAELDAVDVDRVADHTLAHLVRAKRRELELQIEMLESRGTPALCALSIELFGTVSSGLLEQAHAILRSVQSAAAPNGSSLDAEQFARLAELELDHYRGVDPDLSAHVEIRPDIGGVMVANGDLLIPSGLRISSARATALLHHEIGTHVLTYVNGCHQPVRLLADGLAGHEETQEALALLAEWLSGGFGPVRLRQLAARVVAVHGMVEGQAFRQVHNELVAAEFSPEAAFDITMRVFRAGGLSKDLGYLRGLIDLLDHLHGGHDLDALWLGKMPLAAVPLVEDLRDRGVLQPPLLMPRYLDDPSAITRLRTIDRVKTILDLIEG
jgi:uncharacterized protein (TIGR02421 family)